MREIRSKNYDNQSSQAKKKRKKSKEIGIMAPVNLAKRRSVFRLSQFDGGGWPDNLITIENDDLVLPSGLHAFVVAEVDVTARYTDPGGGGTHDEPWISGGEFLGIKSTDILLSRADDSEPVMPDGSPNPNQQSVTIEQLTEDDQQWLSQWITEQAEFKAGEQDPELGVYNPRNDPDWQYESQRDMDL